jgi:hypothetical protein
LFQELFFDIVSPRDTAMLFVRRIRFSLVVVSVIGSVFFSWWIVNALRSTGEREVVDNVISTWFYNEKAAASSKR